MTRKTVFLLGLLILLSTSLFAQIDHLTGIRLISPAPEGLSTATTVTPDLAWRRQTMDGVTGVLIDDNLSATSVYFYVYVNVNSNFDGVEPIRVPATGFITNPTHQFYNVPLKEAFENDTMYFWYVRQFLSTGVEQTPSDIGSFRTPQQSVLPIFSWDHIAIGGQINITNRYRIRYSENPAFPDSVNGVQTTFYIEPTDTEDVLVGAVTVAVPVTATRMDSSDLALKYGTTYYWQVQRNNNAVTVSPVVWPTVWQQGGSFTTKQLNIISEVWQYTLNGTTWLPLSMYGEIKPIVDDDDDYRLRYTAITDEFEELLSGVGRRTSSWYNISSNVSDIDELNIHLMYGDHDPDISFANDPRLILRGTLAPIKYGIDPDALLGDYGVDAEAEVPLYITNDQIITMLFEYGSPFTVITTLGTGVVIPPIAPAAGVGVTVHPNIETNPEDPPIFADGTTITGPNVNLDPEDIDLFQFRYRTAAATPLGASLKIIVKNMDNGQEEVRYAFGDGSSLYYSFIISADEINEMFYGPGKVTNGRPIRISVYPADYPQYPEPFAVGGTPPAFYNFDFMWFGFPEDLTPVITSASNVGFNKNTHSRIEEIVISSIVPNPGWVRIFSNDDPVGFVIQASPNQTIIIGDYTDPATRTIRAFMGTTTVPKYVFAATIDFNGYPLPTLLPTAPNPTNVRARTQVVAQSYTPFNLVTPSNNLTGESIFQYFEWTSAFSSERSWDGITHYRFRISTIFSDFTAATPSGNLQTYELTDTFIYLGDLPFSTTYYWRVDVVPTGANSIPANMGGLPAWQFTTRAAPTGSNPRIEITGTIAADRTLLPDVNYHFFNNPIIAPGATLTIPNDSSARAITFAPNTTLIVQGDLVVDGAASGTIITMRPDPTTAGTPPVPTTWNGIQFDGTYHSDPTVVGSKLEYVIIRNAINPISVAPGGVPVNIEINNTHFIDVHNGIEIGPESIVTNTTFGDRAATLTTGARGFANVGTADGFAIKGGAYIENVWIDGYFTEMAGTPPAAEARYFLGSGIVTSNPNAQIIGSTIKDVKGNGIHISTNTQGEAIIHDNNITGTGNSESNFSILANPGATVSKNRIGNWNVTHYRDTDLDPAGATYETDYDLNARQRNFGYAIMGGHLIRDNLIAQNLGLGAILASPGAEVLFNRIYDNEGNGIQNGGTIQNNLIFNTAVDGPIHPVDDGTPIRVLNGIEADMTGANVSYNTITDHTGFGIRYGAVIAKNTITNTIPPETETLSVENQYAIFASPGATVDENAITNPVGYGIRGGKVVINNLIAGDDATQEGAFGIEAELPTATYEVEVSKNTVRNMRGNAITNGTIIHGNTIVGGLNGILAQDFSIIDSNMMNKSVVGAPNPPTSVGYAIRGGREITLNWIERYTLGSTTVRGEFDIVTSPTMEVFNGNTLIANVANQGSIFEVYRPASPLSLEIIGNTFTNNRYKVNTMRLHSAELSVIDNSITNNIAKNAAGTQWLPTTGGPVGVATAVEREAVAIYILLHADPVVMEGNLVYGHQGNVYGAALYVESASINNVIYIQNENALSNNHATGEGAMGAAIYHHSGTVLLGPDMRNGNDVEEMKGNTITANSVPNIAATLPYDNEEVIPLYAGAAVHTMNSFTSTVGKMYVYRNIIASNHGNWAIWGAPEALAWNNLYQNTFDGNEEHYFIITEALKDLYEPEYDDFDDGQILFDQSNRGSNFKYDHSILFNANNNFWGQRYDAAVGSTLYHQPDDGSLGQVVYQHPMLPSSHQHTPSLVSGIRDVLVIGEETMPSVTQTSATSSVRTLSPEVPYHIVVRATDSNEFTRDFTEVLIQNQNNQYFIDALLLETGFYTHVYETNFTLIGLVNPTPADLQAAHCLINNFLPVEDGDVIVFISKLDPTKRITLIVDFSNRLMVYPSITHATLANDLVVETFHFGQHLQGVNITKRFTFTNGGGVPLYMPIADAIYMATTVDAITAGTSPVFSINTTMPLPTPDSTNPIIIPPNGSIDVMVTFTNAGASHNHAYLHVNASTDPAGTPIDANRVVKIQGETLASWDDADWAGIPDASFFGSKVPGWIQPNQMVVQGRVRIVNTAGAHVDAPIGTVVGAFVNSINSEQIRGWSTTYNATGNISIVVNTADAGEIIYFKIFVPHTSIGGPAFYDTPRTYDVVSIPGGTVGGTGTSRNNGPIPIVGAAVVVVQGHIANHDGTDWAGGYVTNDYAAAYNYTGLNLDPWFTEVGDHFQWITDGLGIYRFGVWAGHGLALNPVSSRLAFQTTNFNPGGSLTEIKPNDVASASPHNTQYSVYVNDTDPIINHHNVLSSVLSLDFESFLKVNFLAGKIYLSENNPYANGEFSVVLGGDDDAVIHRTDEFGYFYSPVVVGANVLRIQITAAQFARSGYGDIQSEDYYLEMVEPGGGAEIPVALVDNSTLTGPNMMTDRIRPLEFILSPQYNIERTQKVLLRKGGWNLVSFNLDFPSDAMDVTDVFAVENQFIAETGVAVTPVVGLPQGQVVDVRTPTLGWVPGAAAVTLNVGYDLGYQSHRGGYFVRTGVLTASDLGIPATPISKDIYVTATATPRFNYEMNLMGNNWNLVGYSPGRPAQTRAVVANNPDVEYIVSDSWVYFQEEDTIGASTMKYMSPSEGYWMENRTEAGLVEMRYNNPDYNNVLKRFWLNTAATGTSSHAFGIIDDEYLGYPMAVTGGITVANLVLGQTYKILRLHPDQDDPTNATAVAAAAAAFRLAGAVTGLPGEIFTVINKEAVTNTDGMARNILEPKPIQVNITGGVSVSGISATADFNPHALNQFYGTFEHPDPHGEITYTPYYRILTSGEYGSAISSLEGTGMNGFMTSVNAIAANDFSTFGFGIGTYYLVFSDKDLNDTDTRNSASIVVYALVVNNIAANYPQVYPFGHANAGDPIGTGMFGVSLVNNPTGPNRQVFDGVRVGGADSRVFVIALPSTDDIALSAKLFFDTRGHGTYVALASGASNVAAANLIVSGGVDPGNNPGTPTLPITGVTHGSMRRFWVRSGSSAELDSSEAYTVLFVRLESGQGFTFERVDRDPVPPPPPPPDPSESTENPFGIVQVKTNNHFLIARIHNNGNPIHTGYWLAAYVGDELRGKVQVTPFSGQTWAYLMMNTSIPDEVINLKIWKSEDKEPGLFTETILSIPGGTTGSVTNPMLFDYDLVIIDVEDDPGVVHINELRQNYPNPFNPTTNIRFSLKDTQHANITVYNIRGQRVVTLVDDVLEKGEHHIVWDGVNSHGRQVGSGIYFIRMQTEGYTKVNRAALIK